MQVLKARALGPSDDGRNAAEFRNGREPAAWLGLVPRQRVVVVRLGLVSKAPAHAGTGRGPPQRRCASEAANSAIAVGPPRTHQLRGRRRQPRRLVQPAQSLPRAVRPRVAPRLAQFDAGSTSPRNATDPRTSPPAAPGTQRPFMSDNRRRSDIARDARSAPRARQDQKARVVRHQPQARELLLRHRADPGVERLHLERAGLPADQRQPASVRHLRHVPNPAPEQTSKPWRSAWCGP